MKTLLINLCTSACLMTATLGTAATISFAQLGSATPDDSYGTGPGFNTTFTTPGSGNDQSDFTFQFTFTMPTTLTTGNSVLVDFGGATVGTAVWLENDRLVFRSANSGGGILYLTSNALTASTQYEVTGSILINNSGDDEAQLYLNGVSGVDTGFLNHQPVAEINNDWTGGNGSGYGEVGGGDVQNGVTGNNGTGSANGFITTDGTLDSPLDLYYDTYVIPEPSSIALLGLAGLAAFFLRRRG